MKLPKVTFIIVASTTLLGTLSGREGGSMRGGDAGTGNRAWDNRAYWNNPGANYDPYTPNYYPNEYYNPGYYPGYNPYYYYETNPNDDYNSPQYNQQENDPEAATFPYHPV